jgi:hypothetical protein
MTKETEQLKELKEIRSLMERSSSFLSLSGLSGISAGITGLAAGVLLQIITGPYLDPEKGLTDETRNSIVITNILILVITLITAIALAYYFSRRKALSKGEFVLDKSAKNLAINMLIPLITGGVFCILMLIQGIDFLIYPSMLIFFGLALVSGSKYTLNEIKWLGLCQIILGLAAVIFYEHALIFWTAGFGLLNIIYGIVMYKRHDRDENTN